MNKFTIYSDEELQEIQNIESVALKVILDICEEIHVQCFLIGGSALGAVRHNGFIPWDDDIDVGMLRNDYVKFLKEAPKYLPEQYYLQTPYNNKINPYFYSKLRVNGTRFVEYCNHNLKMHHGVYVDIFPFDEVPNDEEANKRHFKKAQKMLNLFVLRQSPDMSKKAETGKEKIKSLVRKIIHFSLKIIPHDYLILKIDSHIQKYNGTEQEALACLNFPIRKTEYIKKKDLYPLKKHRFGDIEIFIPNNYEIYLLTHYGDFMKLPPKDKRYGHKPYEVKLN